MKYTRGFTIIELLVVIAIIGLLASIVLASLGTSRTKASDASLKGVLHSIRTAAAEQYFLINNAYGTAGTTAGSCAGPTAGSDMWNNVSTNMLGLINSATTTAGGASNVDCGTATGAWAVAARLPGGGYWCVDSAGAVRGVSSTTATAYTTLTGASGAKQIAGGVSCR